MKSVTIIIGESAFAFALWRIDMELRRLYCPLTLFGISENLFFFKSGYVIVLCLGEQKIYFISGFYNCILPIGSGFLSIFLYSI